MRAIAIAGLYVLLAAAVWAPILLAAWIGWRWIAAGLPARCVG